MHQNIWYPFTIQKGALEPLKVEKGDGIWLQLEDGRRIMDCISSWWVNLYGHAHPKVADAISKQAQKLEQVIFADLTHEPAEKVAEKLAGLLPAKLNKVFYSDDGSTAVEVAMKIAFQYWKNRSEDRKSFICFEGAYHGDTFGAMSAGARSIFTNVFKELLFDVDFVPYPCTWLNDKEVRQKERVIVEQLEKMLQDYPEKYAGVMIEPLVQGASGMRMCRRGFLKELKRICEEYNTLLLFDEVMTGFGRTGARFASDRAYVEPDIICLAKGLTGGFLPLSVTVCSNAIFDVFNSTDPMKTFWHGHSYTANPLGCAAALASFELLEEYFPVFSEMEHLHLQYLAKLRDHPLVKKRRATGTIAAFDIAIGPQNGYLNKVSQMFKKRSVEEGMLFRPLGNVMYLMPPYCTTEKQLAEMYKVIDIILDEIEQGQA